MGTLCRQTLIGGFLLPSDYSSDRLPAPELRSLKAGARSVEFVICLKALAHPAADI
jgi:hypothetical protein